MSTLTDSNIFIDALRGFEAALDYLDDRAADGGIHASVVTRAEIRAGAGGAHPGADRLLSRVHWEPVGIEIADRSGEFARAFGARFPGIGLTDYIVAATADVLGFDVATRNVKHFPMFPDLVAPY